MAEHQVRRFRFWAANKRLLGIIAPTIWPANSAIREALESLQAKQRSVIEYNAIAENIYLA
jgi:hypothetical protein